MAFADKSESTSLGDSPVSSSPSIWRTPWGVKDILKGIGLAIAGAILVAIPANTLAVIIAGDADITEDTRALTILFAASLLLESVLLYSAIRFSVRKYRLSLAALGLRWPARGGVGLAFGLVLMSLVVVYVFFALLSLAGVDPGSDIPEEAFSSILPILLLALLSLLFAPVIEEVFFRGFIFGGLRSRWGLWPAALASGLLFGLAHLGNPGTFYTVIPIGAVGVIFALGYAYSGSILATIIAHFLFNLASFIVGVATS